MRKMPHKLHSCAVQHPRCWYASFFYRLLLVLHHWLAVPSTLKWDLNLAQHPTRGRNLGSPRTDSGSRGIAAAKKKGWGGGFARVKFVVYYNLDCNGPQTVTQWE
jgi:hypothetical protein